MPKEKNRDFSPNQLTSFGRYYNKSIHLEANITIMKTRFRASGTQSYHVPAQLLINAGNVHECHCDVLVKGRVQVSFDYKALLISGKRSFILTQLVQYRCNDFIGWLDGKSGRA